MRQSKRPAPANKGVGLPSLLTKCENWPERAKKAAGTITESTREMTVLADNTLEVTCQVSEDHPERTFSRRTCVNQFFRHGRKIQDYL